MSIDGVPEGAEPAWRAGVITREPPAHIRHVQESSGSVADRLDEPCYDCPDGSLWRWRHNGGTECWFEMDGIGPWEGWR